MLSKEDYAVIKSLNERGVYLKDIAAELEVHPRTVRRALKRGSAPEPERKPRSSKLDAYKAKVDQWLGKEVWNAMVILREIQKRGYDGGRTILRQYIQPKRVLRPNRATVRFETEPGKQLQSDWGEVLVDNQKSTVLQASNIGQPKFNEGFMDLALQYGFTPRACRPYRARTTGKDERMLGYIKQNFFVRYRSFESWVHHYD